MHFSGVQAHLACSAEGGRGVRGQVKWERVDGGELPYHYRVQHGVLNMPRLLREHAGIYRCTLTTESGASTVTETQLAVSGMFNPIPRFNVSPYRLCTLVRWP